MTEPETQCRSTCRDRHPYEPETWCEGCAVAEARDREFRRWQRSNARLDRRLRELNTPEECP